MTGIFSNRCNLALQAVLYMSGLGEKKIIKAKYISEKIAIPREFTSKVLQDLAKAGIISSQKGKNGGFYIDKPHAEIFLIDIVKAIDGLELFKECLFGFPGCSHENPCPIHVQWGGIRKEIFELLSNTSILNLDKLSDKKIDQIVKDSIGKFPKHE